MTIHGRTLSILVTKLRKQKIYTSFFSDALIYLGEPDSIGTLLILASSYGCPQSLHTHAVRTGACPTQKMFCKQWLCPRPSHIGKIISFNPCNNLLMKQIREVKELLRAQNWCVQLCMHRTWRLETRKQWQNLKPKRAAYAVLLRKHQVFTQQRVDSIIKDGVCATEGPREPIKVKMSSGGYKSCFDHLKISLQHFIAYLVFLDRHASLAKLYRITKQNLAKLCKKF